MTNSDFLSVAEAAEYLKIKTNTLYTWISKKVLPTQIYKKLGRRTIFLKTELDKWVVKGCRFV